MADAKISKADVADLFDRYVSYLDERRFDDWLNLFTDDCYYVMILHEDYVKDTNILLIGEDKRKLAGRIEVGQTVEQDVTTHLLTALSIAAEGDKIKATSNFAVLRKSALNCAGRYHMSIVKNNGELKISRCTAVLNNDVIHGTIYLPV